jgi:hypothetical protein
MPVHAFILVEWNCEIIHLANRLEKENPPPLVARPGARPSWLGGPTAGPASPRPPCAPCARRLEPPPPSPLWAPPVSRPSPQTPLSLPPRLLAHVSLARPRPRSGVALALRGKPLPYPPPFPPLLRPPSPARSALCPARAAPPARRGLAVLPTLARARSRLARSVRGPDAPARRGFPPRQLGPRPRRPCSTRWCARAAPARGAAFPCPLGSRPCPGSPPARPSSLRPWRAALGPRRGCPGAACPARRDHPRPRPSSPPCVAARPLPAQLTVVGANAARSAPLSARGAQRGACAA